MRTKSTFFLDTQNTPIVRIVLSKYMNNILTLMCNTPKNGKPAKVQHFYDTELFF